MKKYILHLVLFFGVTGFANGQNSDWQWQNPLPTATTLREVCFVDENTGWAIGAGGIILKTHNGGASWQRQQSNVSSTLYDVYFMDAQKGWAVGSGGVLLLTLNGGGIWYRQPSGTTQTLYSIYFVNNLTGYAVGQNGTIIKSIDGGANWNTQISGTTSFLNSVFFTDAQTGWTVGGFGVIRKTSDGGNTWVSQVSGSPYNLLSCSFINNQTGWAVGDIGTTLKTTNGGTTWQSQPIGTAGSITSIKFLNAQLGWAVAEYGKILKTTNGGNTWVNQASGTTNILFSIHIANQQKAFIVGEYGTLLKTSNGGTTWNNLKQGLTTQLRSVHFSNDQNGCAVGQSGTILKTANGGNTWLNVPGGTTRGLTSICFSDDLHAWAVGDSGTILKSTTGGISWVAQNSGSTINLKSVWFTDAQKGWAVGDVGALRTTDGGSTWLPVSLGGSSSQFSSLFFLNSQFGWAAGAGKISRTVDGGVTWQNQLTGNTVLSICFVDPLNGWAVSNLGRIMHTTNGGISWQQQSSGTTSALNAVHFIDNLIGLAVGQSGKILKTSNGGITWENQFSSTPDDLYSVFFKTPSTGWIAGQGGTILFGGISSGIPSGLISGTLFRQESTGCDPFTTQPIVKDVLVKVMPGSFYGISNGQGSYGVRVPVDVDNPTQYSISALEMNNLVSDVIPVCPPGNAYSVTLDTLPDTLAGKDFSFDITPCHHLQVQIASSQRRLCFRNSTTVSYVNQGSIPAPDSYVLVEFPHWVRPLLASRPHVALNDSTWQFNLDTVQAGSGGSITIIDSVVCGHPEIMGLTQCTKATIYPAPDCPPSPNWSGAEVSVSGVCDQGVVHLGIYNTGPGDMADSVDYSVFMDSIQVRVGKVKLVSGDSLKLDVDAYGMTVTLSATQVAHHPSEVFVSTTIEACDDTVIYIPKPTINHFPKPKVANSKTHCMPIRTSYDPNDKQAFPIGFTANHVVKPGTQMEYLVRFQNTGNDTAFTVYVIDSLDNSLNPEAFQIGAVSHPYEVSMQTTKQGRTFLRWQFNHINLPDSNVNELKSHGFFQYRISPKTGIALGSQAKNEAAIYFDFNPPVLTNRTMTTFDNLVFTNPGLSASVHVVVLTLNALSMKQLGVTLYPNPVTQNQLTVSFSSKGSLTMLNALGQVVYQKENMEGTSILPLRLRSGIYTVRISTQMETATEKVVVLE